MGLQSSRSDIISQEHFMRDYTRQNNSFLFPFDTGLCPFSWPLIDARFLLANLVFHHTIICLSFHVSVSRNGQNSKGASAHFHKDRLLSDPEHGASHRLRHHSAHHHVCWRDQPQLKRSRHDLESSFLLTHLGGKVICKVNVL